MALAPRITVDTNCVINLLDVGSASATSIDEISRLLALAMRGKVEIAVTTRSESDLLKDRDEERRKGILRRLAAFPVISSRGRWEVSAQDADRGGDERTGRLVQEIQQILFPGLSTEDKRYGNKINDVDHLVGHIIDRRDIFVTDDRGILKTREALKRGPGVVVMNPGECAAHLEGIEARAQPRSLPSEGINPNYHEPRLRGRVTFDYSNNNHRFAIGEGSALFETRWSRAGSTAIHAYTESPSIDSLALARDAREIVDIADATAFDYSSRVRTPQLDQVVVWRNVNGLYAATKVLAIRCESHGSDCDELTFEFVILAEGGADFTISE